MENQDVFFDFAAEVGLTKHLGGVAASQELAELCHVGAHSYVLDVGCGAGATPAFLARQFNCRVVGVDIRPRMIERAQEMARRQGVTDQVEFRVADVQNLPFLDGTFDAVLSESVTAFPPDKARAVSEYARVTRAGGYVGLGESTWLKEPVPEQVQAWARQDVGASVKPLSAAEWVRLLEGAGLTGIIEQVRAIDVSAEAKGLAQRYGAGGVLRSSVRMLRLYLRDPAYRQFVKRVRQAGVIPGNLSEYMGYGLFVGRK